MAEYEGAELSENRVFLYQLPEVAESIKIFLS